MRSNVNNDSSEHVFSLLCEVSPRIKPILKSQYQPRESELCKKRVVEIKILVISFKNYCKNEKEKRK